MILWELVVNEKVCKKANGEILNSTLNVKTKERSLDRNSNRRRSKSKRVNSKLKREKVECQDSKKNDNFKKNYKAPKKSNGGGQNKNHSTNIFIDVT